MKSSIRLGITLIAIVLASGSTASLGLSVADPLGNRQEPGTGQQAASKAAKKAAKQKESKAAKKAFREKGPTAADAEQESKQQEPRRASLRRSQREKRAQSLEKPRRGFWEKQISRVERGTGIARVFMDGWRGFHFAGGDFPAGAGFTYGIGFTDLAVGSVYEESDQPNRVDVSAGATASTNSYLGVDGHVVIHNLDGSPFGIGLHGRYLEYPEEDFFGAGRTSLEDNRTSYRFDNTEIGAELFWQIPERPWLIGVGAYHLDPEIAPGEDDRFPSIEELFGTGVAGFLRQPDFLRFDTRVGFDWREQPNTRRGGLYSVTFSYYDDRDLNAFDFRRWEIDLQQYFPVPYRRAFVLRANAVLTDTDPGEAVPFYFQPTLGGSERLRGFREFRFRDANSMLLTAEYRWDAWSAMQGALFVDVGKVVPEASQLDFNDLEVSYGAGLRLKSAFGFIARFDIGISREGVIPFFKFTNVF